MPTRMRTAATAIVVAVTGLLVTPALGHAQATQTFNVPDTNADVNSLVVGADGNLWFAEQNGFALRSISQQGQFGAAVSVPRTMFDDADDGPSDLISSGGSLWLVSDLAGSLYRYAPGGALTEVAGDPNSVTENGPDTIGPSDTGGVWASDFFDDGLSLYPAGAAAGVAPQAVAATYRGTYGPPPLTLGPDGRIYYPDDGSALRSVNDAGTERSYPITGIALGAPDAMAFDGHGSLWFTADKPPTSVLPAENGTIGVLRAGGSGATAGPLPDDAVGLDIARDPVDGRMYFSFQISGRSDTPTGGIGRVDPTTGKVSLVAIVGHAPGSIAFTPNGTLWFLDNRANQVGRVTPAKLFATADRAPAVSVALAGTRLSAILRHRRLSAVCTLAGPGRCAVTISITAATARHLALHVPAHAKRVTLAHGARTLKKKGKVTLTLTLSRRVSSVLQGRGSLKVTVSGTSSAHGLKPVSTSRTVTLR